MEPFADEQHLARNRRHILPREKAEQCEIQLGLMHYGEGEKAEPDLELARHTIDLMGVLHEKTKGNLTLEEQRMLENSLTELRFRYVQVSDEVAKAAAQKA